MTWSFALSSHSDNNNFMQNFLMARSTGNNNTNLLRLVEERALSKKVEEEQKKQEIGVPYFHKDCISNILIRLPLQSLSSTRFLKVCLRHQLDQSNQITFSVEASLLQQNSFSIFDHPITNSMSKFCIQFMYFKEGKSKSEEYKVSCLGNIRATCNGLVLLDNRLKKGGLVVINPVTRKMVALPVGTLYPPHDESYGFALSEATGEYKVVHLFRDSLGYISCEILNLGTRFWRGVNGPSFGLFGWFGYKPVSAIGALHWIPEIDASEYIVSMEVDHERFQTILLPTACRTYDRIIEKDGFLCFVTHEGLNIDIWVLKSLSGDFWTKHHSITKGGIIDMVPLFSLRMSEDMIFTRDEDGSFYTYDFTLEVMTKVEPEKECFLPSDSYFPHVNSLISWEKSWDVCD
ncbi:hypothetical protein Patl1_07371 [Pistacia atlantica]|uniref:Uncharacterized protein n=1 Tax=Pistacia atlantica TaxID=434234 RepID=A0ACC1AF69_9ROSI|nr:hypothetical protein Patl1_07371 [Pistacia atlantica]